VRIEFTPSDGPTVGIELELHLVDKDTGDLVSMSNEILEELGAGCPDGTHPKAKHELFQSTIEIITDVCETPAQARSDLAETLDQVRAAAASRGLELVSSGTHPFARARDQVVSPSPRYEELVEAMQWTARRLLICGLHVHVGVSSGERAIAVVNEVGRHLPLFLALSASSPFFEGEDSGLASARSKVFESLPTAGLPPPIAAWADFEAFMATLLETHCISSIREVWWDIRPHPDFGTVELRVCDAPPTLREVTALAALAQSLVVWCDRAADAGTLPRPPHDWTVRENRWLAARYGVEADLIVGDETGGLGRVPVVDLIEALVEQLRSVSRDLGCEAELDSVLDIVSAGSGAQRQRRIVEQGGSLRDVVSHLARELSADRPLI
jgi:carboxylate-amine ligase